MFDKHSAMFLMSKSKFQKQTAEKQHKAYQKI